MLESRSPAVGVKDNMKQRDYYAKEVDLVDVLYINNPQIVQRISNLEKRMANGTDAEEIQRTKQEWVILMFKLRGLFEQMKFDEEVPLFDAFWSDHNFQNVLSQMTWS